MASILLKFQIRRRLVFALGGLGHLFLDGKLKTVSQIVNLIAFKFAFSNKYSTLILQNEDDAMIKNLNVDGSKIKLIKGAGVEIEKFILANKVWPTKNSAAISIII